MSNKNKLNQLAEKFVKVTILEDGRYKIDALGLNVVEVMGIAEMLMFDAKCKLFDSQYRTKESGKEK